MIYLQMIYLLIRYYDDDSTTVYGIFDTRKEALTAGRNFPKASVVEIPLNSVAKAGWF